MEAFTEHPDLREIVTTEDQLETILGAPNPRAIAKVVDVLDDICLAFIARSPFLIVASSDAAGRVDVSPKGDPRRASFMC